MDYLHVDRNTEARKIEDWHSRPGRYCMTTRTPNLSTWEGSYAGVVVRLGVYAPKSLPPTAAQSGKSTADTGPGVSPASVYVHGHSGATQAPVHLHQCMFMVTAEQPRQPRRHRCIDLMSFNC